MRHAASREGRYAGEESVREHFRILSAQLVVDGRKVFGGHLLADEGILERPPPDETEVGKSVEHLPALEEIAGLITAQAVRIADDESVRVSGFELVGR